MIHTDIKLALMVAGLITSDYAVDESRFGR